MGIKIEPVPKKRPFEIGYPESGYTEQDRDKTFDRTKIDISLKLTNLLIGLYIANMAFASVITILQGLKLIELDLGYYITTFLTTISIAAIPTIILRLLTKK